MASMTLVGALLLLVGGGPAPRTDGLSIAPLASTTIASDPLTQTRRPLDRSRWQAVVIHHSGSPKGDPASIEKENLGRSDQGLGHHFIIGNGSGMDDGQVHIGYRWLDQLPGRHASGPNAAFYNDSAISICLVGDGNRHAFTPAQIQQLTSLVDSLRRQLDLPADRVLLYSDVARSADPGRLFPAGLYGLPSGRP